MYERSFDDKIGGFCGSEVKWVVPAVFCGLSPQCTASYLPFSLGNETAILKMFIPHSCGRDKNLLLVEFIAVHTYLLKPPFFLVSHVLCCHQIFSFAHLVYIFRCVNCNIFRYIVFPKHMS